MIRRNQRGAFIVPPVCSERPEFVYFVPIRSDSFRIVPIRSESFRFVFLRSNSFARPHPEIPQNEKRIRPTRRPKIRVPPRTLSRIRLVFRRRSENSRH